MQWHQLAIIAQTSNKTPSKWVQKPVSEVAILWPDYSGTKMILKNPNKYGFNSYIPSSKAFSHGVTSLLYASTGWAQGLQVCHWHIRIGSLAKTGVNCCNTKKNKHQKIIAGSCQTWEKKTPFPFSVHFCILRTSSCKRSNKGRKRKENKKQHKRTIANPCLMSQQYYMARIQSKTIAAITTPTCPSLRFG